MLLTLRQVLWLKIPSSSLIVSPIRQSHSIYAPAASSSSKRAPLASKFPSCYTNRLTTFLPDLSPDTKYADAFYLTSPSKITDSLGPHTQAKLEPDILLSGLTCRLLTPNREVPTDLPTTKQQPPHPKPTIKRLFLAARSYNRSISLHSLTRDQILARLLLYSTPHHCYIPPKQLSRPDPSLGRSSPLRNKDQS